MSDSNTPKTAQATPLTYGQRAVGLSFNPGGNLAVTNAKTTYATIIDQLNDARLAEKAKGDSADAETIRLYSVAITEAQSAQMWAVKAITWTP